MTYLQCVLNNFQYNFGPLSDLCIDKLKHNRAKLWRRYWLDFLICNLIIAPAVISFWRGTWDHSLLYLERLLGENCMIQNAVAFTIGALGTQLINFNHEIIKTKIAKHDHQHHRSAWFTFISRLFSVFWGFVDIFLWKSIWDGVDCLFGKTYLTASLTLCGGSLVLICARSLRSASSLPVGIVMDDISNCCSASTFLQTQVSDPIWRRCYDAFLTFMAECFVIFAWHGLWTIEDLLSDEYGFSHEKTAWISLICGIATNFAIFLLQFPFSRFMDFVEKSTFGHELLAHLLGYLLGFLSLFASVNGFRGYWYLLDVYLLPGQEENSLIVGQLFAVLILFSLHAGCSLHAGIFSDASKQLGANMNEYYYTTYFFIKDMESKYTENILLIDPKTHHAKDFAPLLVVTESLDLAPEAPNECNIQKGFLGDDLIENDSSEEEENK